jgi:hypothetical protein
MESNSEGVARIIWKESGTGEVWGLILYPVGGGGGGGGEAKIYAVVMSAIQCPDDPTLDPDDENFRDKMGNIKIEGKSYDTDNPRYDRCTCRELAGKDDEYPEQIVKGTQIEVIKAGSYDNPDYDPDDEDSDEPEKLDWYVAINTEGVYTGIISNQLNGVDSSSIIQIADSDGNLTSLTVYSYYLGQNQIIQSGTGVMVARQQTEGGLRLVVVKSRSVITDTEVL